MATYRDFEDYLKSVFMSSYMGTDDNFFSNFELWITGHTTDDWLKLGDHYKQGTHPRDVNL